MAIKRHKADDIPSKPAISTGISILDFATRVGGFEVGSQNEIFGAESVGKSALSYYLISSAQKQGLSCAYINVEHNFHPAWAKKIAPDLKLSELEIVDVTNGWESWKALQELIVDGYKYIVFDSLGVLVDDGGMQGKKIGKFEKLELEKARVGGASGMITYCVNIMSSLAESHGATIIYINQIRDELNIYAGMSERSPGGHAKQHGMAIRLWLSKSGWLYYNVNKKVAEKTQDAIGFEVSAKIIKNRSATPYRHPITYNFYNEPNFANVIGIDAAQCTIDTAIKKNLITRSGNTYLHPAWDKIVGFDNIYQHLVEHPEIVAQINSELQEIAKEEYTDEIKGKIKVIVDNTKQK